MTVTWLSINVRIVRDIYFLVGDNEVTHTLVKLSFPFDNVSFLGMNLPHYIATLVACDLDLIKISLCAFKQKKSDSSISNGKCQCQILHEYQI